jgi:hypothetical protein
MTLTRDRLLELLQYDAVSGVFYWRISRGTRKAGSAAGSQARPDGYVYVKIDRVLYRSSRLIWLYVYGRWPVAHIDHINGDTSDDRLVNLRGATRSQNLGNRKRNKNNASGFKGVVQRGKRFRAYINKDRQRLWLGNFNTAEQAHEAYFAKAKELFGDYARAS